MGKVKIGLYQVRETVSFTDVSKSTWPTSIETLLGNKVTKVAIERRY